MEVMNAYLQKHDIQDRTVFVLFLDYCNVKSLWTQFVLIEAQLNIVFRV